MLAQLNDNKSCEKVSPLQAANTTHIPAFGTKILPLDLGLHRKFRWPVHIADITKPILGDDFLRQSDLLVDLARECLIDAQTFYSTAKTSREQALGLSSVFPPVLYNSMLESFLSSVNLISSSARSDTHLHITSSQMAHQSLQDFSISVQRSSKLPRKSSIRCLLLVLFTHQKTTGPHSCKLLPSLTDKAGNPMATSDAWTAWPPMTATLSNIQNIVTL